MLLPFHQTGFYRVTMNITHFWGNELFSTPGGFGAESIPIAIGISAQQHYNLENFKGFVMRLASEKIDRKMVEDYVEPGIDD